MQRQVYFESNSITTSQVLLHTANRLLVLRIHYKIFTYSVILCLQYQLNYMLLYLNFLVCKSFLAQCIQSINQSILFLIKCYIINALSAVQWNTHISLNTYIYIYSEIQHTYKHSYKAAISAQIQCFYFRHTHSHTRGRCERPVPSLFLVIHL